MNDAPSQSQDKFIVRLPDGLRDRIKKAAEANKRSMNAEIVRTLEINYPDLTRVQVAIEAVNYLYHQARSASTQPERDSLEEQLSFALDELEKAYEAEGIGDAS